MKDSREKREIKNKDFTKNVSNIYVNWSSEIIFTKNNVFFSFFFLIGMLHHFAHASIPNELR